LAKIQAELKAPKGQQNKFGGYRYRSCEDILESVKPLLAKYDAVLTISDSIEQVGDRIYVKATVSLSSTNTEEEPVTVTAFARESPIKKGMDDSQITGASSSYARKYALNGLFLIDDTKDADTMDNTAPKATQAEIDQLIDHANKNGWTAATSIQRLEERFTVSADQKTIIKDEVKN
jgi:hypothetical protein